MALLRPEKNCRISDEIVAILVRARFESVADCLAGALAAVAILVTTAFAVTLASEK